MTADPMSAVPPNQSMPAIRIIAVTPDDANDLPNGICRALWISSAGTVSVIDASGGSAVSLGSLAVGTVFPGKVSRVRSTGTSATVLALY